jgi:hypothetical protein
MESEPFDWDKYKYMRKAPARALAVRATDDFLRFVRDHWSGRVPWVFTRACQNECLHRWLA